MSDPKSLTDASDSLQIQLALDPPIDEAVRESRQPMWVQSRLSALRFLCHARTTERDALRTEVERVTVRRDYFVRRGDTALDDLAEAKQELKRWRRVRSSVTVAFLAKHGGSEQ